MATAPTAMNTARAISAMMMPIISTSCWQRRGTWNVAMMMRNTNRLSTLRLYSVTQPARNSVPCCASPRVKSSPAKTSASAT